MRTSRDVRSPWGQRLWLDEEEFDSAMDDIRHRAGADTFTVGGGVDVETVLARVYAPRFDYCALPQGVLGRTTFYPDGKLKVEISSQLSGEAEHATVSRRRLRSTVAHECSHIGFHRYLYALNDGPGLFPELRRDPSVLCYTPTIDNPQQRASDWWEYQANRGMAALLLPKVLFVEHVNGALKKLGVGSVEEAIRRGCSEALLDELMQTFDVNRPMVFYRLQQYGFIPNTEQGRLWGVK
jgi:hypothetical protein